MHLLSLNSILMRWQRPLINIYEDQNLAQIGTRLHTPSDGISGSGASSVPSNSAAKIPLPEAARFPSGLALKPEPR